MYVIKKILLLMIIVLIIVVIVSNIYPLNQKNFVTSNNSDFNLIKSNLFQNEKFFIQKESYNSWSLSIPKINLNNIEIKESVDSEVLENYIGHFPFSAYMLGNVCFAAHNSGYENNYFSNLEKLQYGDEIIYTILGTVKKYVVIEKKVISQDDFSVLEDRGENEITLITCVSYSPDLRLCIKAISKE